MRDGWGEAEQQIQAQQFRPKPKERMQQQTGHTKQQQQNHNIQAKSVQCVLADTTAVGGFPPFFVFFILSCSFVSLPAVEQRRKVTSVQPKPCFFVLSVFFIFFFGFFLLLQFPSSFNLPSRTVTIHHVCLNIVELPALLSPSAGIHNQSHMSWKNTFSKREKKRERKQTDKSKKCQ